MLSPRFKNDGNPTFRLSGGQRLSKTAFLAACIDPLKPVACTICATSSFRPVTEKDRYGFEYHAGICEGCGSFQVSKYYSLDNLNLFYSEYYRHIYADASAEELFAAQYKGRGPHIYKFLDGKVSPTSRILEIGCGAGGIVSYLSDQGHEVVGLDLNKEYLQYGRARGLNLIEEDLLEYNPTDKFDVVILADVVEHFSDPVAMLQYVKGLLTPTGQVFVEVPSLESVPKRYNGDLLRYFQNAHVSNYTVETFRNLLSAAGLEPCHMTDGIQSLSSPTSSPAAIKPASGEVWSKLTAIERLYQSDKSGFLVRRLKQGVARRLKVLRR